MVEGIEGDERVEEVGDCGRGRDRPEDVVLGEEETSEELGEGFTVSLVNGSEGLKELVLSLGRDREMGLLEDGP
jgi:hypothetical protein